MKPILLHGDCGDWLANLPSDYADSVVTDPPYGLRFMNRKWDHDVPGIDVWQEALRVLKPGGHLLSFFGTRTYHRGVVAIEDAGFEIRDQIGWLYGSGFPKSHDVSKAIDRANGAERIKVPASGGLHKNRLMNDDGWAKIGDDGALMDSSKPATPQAQQWEGWGTGLKPAHEPVVLARKPLTGTVAENVLQFGTGAVNVNGCRVGTREKPEFTKPKRISNAYAKIDSPGGKLLTEGRWPANIIHDGSDKVLTVFPSAPGQLANASHGDAPKSKNVYGAMTRGLDEASRDKAYNEKGGTNFAMKPGARRGDSGSAARFFYCAKASRSERNLNGVDNKHPTVKPISLSCDTCAAW